MRLLTYSLISAALGALSLAGALATCPNIYVALIQLGDNFATCLIIGNFMMMICMLFGLFVIKIFLTRLREAELDNLFQGLPMVLFEPILRWGSGGSLFGSEFPFDVVPNLLGMISLLCIHWICETRLRVAFFEASPLPKVKLLRLGTLILILSYIDWKLAKVMLIDLYHHGKDFHYVDTAPYIPALLELSVSLVCRYLLDLTEAYILSKADEEEEVDEWEYRPRISFAIDLAVEATGLMSRVTFLAFTRLIHFPMFYRIGTNAYAIGRTAVKLKNSLKTQNELETITTVASAADLERDNICLICREEMVLGHINPRKTPRKLYCGHINHHGCLKSWINRSEFCPTCRQSVHERSSAFGGAAAEDESPMVEVDRESADSSPIDATSPAEEAAVNGRAEAGNMVTGVFLETNMRGIHSGDTEGNTTAAHTPNESHTHSRSSTAALTEPSPQLSRVNTAQSQANSELLSTLSGSETRTGRVLSIVNIPHDTPYPFEATNDDKTRRGIIYENKIFEYRVR